MLKSGRQPANYSVIQSAAGQSSGLAGEDSAISRFAAAATLSNFIRLAHNLCATVRKIDIRFICKAR